ncbi:unnamed protein product [Calicophoron daubneyi]|uniref:Uracil-DNA glycosylase n=1 Tax=Calicophoron daubneyi TaxID=300641 RepID=A0AAV2TIN2_CALDB
MSKQISGAQMLLTAFLSPKNTTSEVGMKAKVSPQKRKLNAQSDSDGNVTDSSSNATNDLKRPKTTEINTTENARKPLADIFLGNADSHRALVNKKVAEIRRRLSARPSRSVLTLIHDLHPEWMCALEPQVLSDSFQKLADFICSERDSNSPIYPPADQVFSWSQLCTPSDVRVVVLGQDPYHGPRQAHGLAFSVQRPVPPPPSLVNMYKEIGSGLDPESLKSWPPSHGDLTGWARQGVLLLNAVLTVRGGQPNSHKGRGWEQLTDAVVRYLDKQKKNLVFILWGANAQKQGAGIDRKRHLVLQGPHPSPLSASRGFFGCGHFVKTNTYLEEHGLAPINWAKLE